MGPTRVSSARLYRTCKLHTLEYETTSKIMHKHNIFLTHNMHNHTLTSTHACSQPHTTHTHTALVWAHLKTYNGDEGRMKHFLTHKHVKKTSKCNGWCYALGLSVEKTLWLAHFHTTLVALSLDMVIIIVRNRGPSDKNNKSRKTRGVRGYGPPEFV